MLSITIELLIPSFVVRDFFMNKLMFWSLLLVSNAVIGQSIGQVNHFQKKWNADTLQMPFERFEVRDLSIPFPDSIYNGADITIRKLTWKGVKGFSYETKVRNDTVVYMIISVKGKRKGELLNSIGMSKVKSMGCSGKVTRTHTVEGGAFRRRKSSVELEKTS